MQAATQLDLLSYTPPPDTAPVQLVGMDTRPWLTHATLWQLLKLAACRVVIFHQHGVTPSTWEFCTLSHSSALGWSKSNLHFSWAPVLGAHGRKVFPAFSACTRSAIMLGATNAGSKTLRTTRPQC